MKALDLLIGELETTSRQNDLHLTIEVVVCGGFNLPSDRAFNLKLARSSCLSTYLQAHGSSILTVISLTKGGAGCVLTMLSTGHTRGVVPGEISAVARRCCISAKTHYVTHRS